MSSARGGRHLCGQFVEDESSPGSEQLIDFSFSAIALPTPGIPAVL